MKLGMLTRTPLAAAALLAAMAGGAHAEEGGTNFIGLGVAALPV